MKKITAILFASVMIASQAYNNNDNGKDSVAGANDMNANKDTTNASDVKKDTTMNAMSVNNDVAKFAVKAANGGMAEVALGKLAEQKATNQKIKEFGRMMVKDHTNANDKLKNLAAEKDISLPTSLSEEDQKHVDDLSKESGKDFDKDNIDLMMKDHKDDINDFEDAVKNFAATTLPILYKHLGAAKALQKSGS